MWIQPYVSCFWCLNPQLICQRVEQGSKAEKQCEYRDAVLPLCYGVFLSAEGLGWLQERFEQEFKGIEEYFDWLGEESEFGGTRAIQAVRVAGESLRWI